MSEIQLDVLKRCAEVTSFNPDSEAEEFLARGTLGLLAEVDRLTDLNRNLSNQLVGMSDRLQESAKQIAADAWDQGYNHAESEIAGRGFWAQRVRANPYKEAPNV